MNSQAGSCAKVFTVSRVIGLLVGLIATGIPLAIIVTLFVLLRTFVCISDQIHWTFFRILNSIIEQFIRKWFSM